MNKKLNFLMILALLVMLVGASASPARAESIPLSVGSISIVDPGTGEPAEPSYFWHVITISAPVTGSDAGATCTVNFGDEWGDWNGLWATDDLGNVSCWYDHTYYATGPYTITMTVTNSDGITTVSNTLSHQVVYADVKIDMVGVADAINHSHAEPSLTNQAVVAVGFIDEGYSMSGCTVDYGEGAGAEPGTFMPDTWPPVCMFPEHTYTTAGAYTITMAVTGYNGSTDSMSISHVVQAPVPLQYSPATLPDGSLGAAYNQTITVSGGLPPYTFQNGSEQWLPAGLTLNASGDSIVISGTPTEAGRVTLDVYVYDGADQHKEIQYEFWIKTDPTLTLTSSLNPSLLSQEVTFSLGSTATVASWPVAPWGQVTFYADGAAIPGCDGLWLDHNGDTEDVAPNPVTCTTSTLAAGSHAITATLTTVYGPYNDATATLAGGQTVNNPIPPSVSLSGTVLNDANANGVFDTGEPGISGVEVDLDKGCDQSVDSTVNSGSDGSYQFTDQEPGQSYCLWVVAPTGYKLTLYANWVEGLDSDVIGMDWGFTSQSLFTWTPTTPDEGGSATFTAVDGWPGNAWAITQPGMECSSQSFYTFGQTVTLTFGASGQYQVCVELTNWAGWPIYDGQLVTVANVAPVAIEGAASIYPEPSDAGSPIQSAEAAFYDVDHLAACTVDYDDGTGPQAGMIYPEENACAGPAHTYTAGGTYHVTFTVTDPEGATGTVTIDHVVTAPTVSADLSLTKIDSKDPVKPGANLVYTLTVSNLGPNTAESLTLVDTLDRNTTYVSVSAPKGWTCKYASGKVSCTSASLASGSSAVIKITVTVNKTAKVGKELVNNATLSSAIYDPIMTNNTVVQKTLVAK